VANLLLARATGRYREMAIRASLGAGPGRLIRQSLTESVLLAVAGGAGGVLLAVWGLDLLVAFGPKNLPRLNELSIDRIVLGFTALLSITTGVVFGLAPALAVARPAELHESLKEGGSRPGLGGARQRTRSVFVVAEVALSLVLLVGAGLLIRSFRELIAVDPGFRTDSLLTLRLQLSGTAYREAEQRIAFYRRAVERIAALPGVAAAGAVNWLPFGGGISGTGFRVVGRPEPEPGKVPVTRVLVADPGYLRAMGIPLVRGRWFTERDTREAPRPFVVSQTFVRRYFSDEEVLGKRLIVQMGDDVPGEVVGVVGDTKHMGLDDEVEPMVYYAHPHLPVGFMTIVMRSRSEPLALASAATAAIRSIDPNQPVSEVRVLEEVISESVARQRFNMALLAIFAAVALALATVGIYGVISYSVAQRTRELGVRVALGARPIDVLRDVVGRGMALAGIGLALGLAASFALTRLMASLLYGVKPTDPLTFGAVATLLGLVALAACVVPARRAAHVDPMAALRQE
jgi:predicted permease